MENDQTQVLNPASLSSLESWVQKTSVKLVQINGQRKYGGPPPGWSGPVPGRGCEVFISQIPRDIYEDRLIPLFQKVGQLYEFRLMMNFSGQNRGFAYAKYGDPRSAGVAVRCLHQHELQEGVRLVVRLSTEKRQLSLGELPVGVERKELLAVLRSLSDGVESVSLESGTAGKSVTAIVQYNSHYTASMAKKVLCEAFKRKFNLVVTVKWKTLSGKPQQKVGQGKLQDSPPAGFQMTPRSYPLPPPPPDHSFSKALRQSVALPSPTLDAVAQLNRVCGILELGLPRYDAWYRFTSPEGFLYFGFRVVIPGLAQPYIGLTRVLPGICSKSLRDEVFQAAAEHVLRHCQT